MSYLKTSLFFLIAVLWLCFSNLAFCNAQTSARFYTNSKYHFSMALPPSWVAQEIKNARPDILQSTGFMYMPGSQARKLGLRVDVRRNSKIKSKLAFRNLITKVAQKKDVMSMPYTTASALATFTYDPNMSVAVNYDLKRDLIYAFSIKNIGSLTVYVAEITFFSKDAVVSLLFIGQPADYAANLPMFADIGNSFHFDQTAQLPAGSSWYISVALLKLIFKIGFFLLLILIGYGAGTFIEKRHYASIYKRELKFMHMPAVPAKLETVMAGSNHPVIRAEMVCGSVVLTEDFFKGFIAQLKNFFGGNLTSYESLLDRARREAILRMKADALNADMIVNVRLATAPIGKEGGANGRGVKSIEAIAYGTAITLGKEQDVKIHSSSAA